MKKHVLYLTSATGTTMHAQKDKYTMPKSGIHFDIRGSFSVNQCRKKKESVICFDPKYVNIPQI